MALDETQRMRLRRMVGDRVKAGVTPFFTDAELDELFAESGEDFTSAAYAGWVTKAGEWADFISIEIENERRSMQQMFEHASRMAGLFGKQVENMNLAATGRVVGRVISLRDKRLGRTAASQGEPVMADSDTHRMAAYDERGRAMMQNDHPDTYEADPTYPAPTPQAM